MVIDIEIIDLGDKVYASKVKHERLGLLKSIVEAKSLSDAQRKINMNMKQVMWKKGISDKRSPVTFHFIAKSVNKNQIGFADTPAELRQYHPDVIEEARNKEDPRIWSLEEIVDEHGKTSYRTVKHDHPLMNKMEIQQELMARMFK